MKGKIVFWILIKQTTSMKGLHQLVIVFLIYLPGLGFSQGGTDQGFDSKWIEPLEYRSVGPTRGGRVTAITGISSQPFTFYMGSTGGGVWRTFDAGQSWDCISDGQIKAGSIGAVEVAPSDPHVIYVGTGSACPRGNISSGIGMYKSWDEGKTWKHIGLDHAGQIGKIIIHPQNPNIAYVAALGNIFAPNSERGVFRTLDGGETWEKVLYISDTTGVVDMVMHPRNPNILYAASWRAERKPWTLIDGGMEGGIWQSRDGGKNWTKLKGGLPEGLLGRIGLAISPVNPNRIWALIQAAEEEKGGLYRSDDGGESWKRINRDHKLRQRGWYYSHITADPKDEHTIYASNTGFYKSIDGGKSFDTRIATPHGDNHGVWINPENTDIMINCNDGGANVSLNGGKTWSTQLNQPTSEFYRVTVDNQFPYRLYAGQQDNSTISVPGYAIPDITDTQHWMEVGGGECADVAVDPRHPHIVYASSYSGELTYRNLQTGFTRQLTAYPHYTEGTAQRKLKYRWQWNYPIFVSHHNPDEIYQGSNYVMKSTNKGETWEIVSPDLTRKLDQYHDIPGGPIQHDATGVEVYSSIFALKESPQTPGLIWVGSDDGLVHLTRDGGGQWENITPEQMPREGTVNKIELSTHDPARAFLAVYNYRYGDTNPYVYRTNDYGKNWKLLTDGQNGIPEGHFVRAIAEDPQRKGLLYAGTEFGMYISFDDGEHWKSFQLNLPHTPITDLEVHQKDLVISTQGRAFWILEDLTLLHQLNDEVMDSDAYLFKPRDTYRTNTGGRDGRPAKLFFYLSEEMEESEVSVAILDENDQHIIRWSTDPDTSDHEKKLEVSTGVNHMKWDLRYPGPEMVEEFVAMVFSAGREPGPKAIPGKYKIQLSVDDQVLEQDFLVLPDPRWNDITKEDYQEQFDMAQDLIHWIDESQDWLRKIRAIKTQVADIANRAVKAGHSEKISAQAKAIHDALTKVEQQLFQEKIETSQDEINYPRVFSNHIARLYRVVVDDDHRPTGGMKERYRDLQEHYKTIIKPLEEIQLTHLKQFNELLEQENVARIIIGKK